jgi:regulator of protease activity HflC (stomatin/prohibitin superfamily)
MPIQCQEIITRDNVSIDVSAVAYSRVTDAGRLTIPTSRRLLVAIRTDPGPAARGTFRPTRSCSP